MKYMGSKNRIAKHILPIILKDRKEGQWYVEPFVGGANMIDKVDGNRIGNDHNIYVIKLLKAIQNGFIPPDSISEEEYKHHQGKKMVNPLTAFIGFGCSYSGKWFGGYARGNASNGESRNYCLESKRNLLKQKSGIIGIEFSCCQYWNLPIPPNSIIYCDPPYENTTKYGKKFDHGEFWNWCRNQKLFGHTIFISEYNAPEDFKCIWQKEVNSSLTKNTGAKKATEKLFTI